MKKYEFYILSASLDNVNIRTSELQSIGWELCGNLAIDPMQPWCGDFSIRIPFKREIKQFKVGDVKKVEKHKERHILLHKEFDELLADFIGHTEKGVTDVPIIELLRWSHKQTQNPDE